MSPTIHREYKYFHSTVQAAKDRRQKFHFCRLPFAVNVMLNVSNKFIIYSLFQTFGKIRLTFGMNGDNHFRMSTVL